MGQIITNFVLNSLTHGFERDQSGEIRISVSQSGEDLLLRYSDNGKGMSPEAQRRAFDPFYTSNRSGGSSGLGLHIVYKIVTEKLAGRVDLNSAPGQGVVFSIQIPCNCRQTLLDRLDSVFNAPW